MPAALFKTKKQRERRLDHGAARFHAVGPAAPLLRALTRGGRERGLRRRQALLGLVGPLPGGDHLRSTS